MTQQDHYEIRVPKDPKELIDLLYKADEYCGVSLGALIDRIVCDKPGPEACEQAWQKFDVLCSQRNAAYRLCELLGQAIESAKQIKYNAVD